MGVSKPTEMTIRDSLQEELRKRVLVASIFNSQMVELFSWPREDSLDGGIPKKV